MVLSAIGSGLVAGSTTTADAMTTKLIRVTRSFLYKGQPIAVGAELSLPKLLAEELRSSNKVVILPDPVLATPQAVAQTDETVVQESVVSDSEKPSKKGGGKRHAW